LEDGLTSLSTPFSSWHLLFSKTWDHRTRDLDGYHSTYSPNYLNTILFVEYKMVVLTIVTQQNEGTIYFENPIPKVHFMKLISCSLYNSWDNLKQEFSATFTEQKNKETNKLLPGHYSLETLATEIENLFPQSKYKLEAKIYQPLGQLVIRNPGIKLIHFDRDFADFLSMRQKHLLFVNFDYFLSHGIFHSLRHDRHRAESVQWQKVRYLRLVCCKRATL